MIYLMLYSRYCGHLACFAYTHRLVPRPWLALCRCPPGVQPRDYPPVAPVPGTPGTGVGQALAMAASSSGTMHPSA